MYFLGRIYSCWKVLTRETSPVIYYLSPTKWFNRIASGCSFYCFHSRAKKAQEQHPLIWWMRLCAGCGSASLLTLPFLDTPERPTVVQPWGMRDLGMFAFFLLLRLFINIGSISSCVREKWNVSFIEKVKTKIAECSLLDKTREANITSFRIYAQHYKLLIPQPQTKSCQ